MSIKTKLTKKVGIGRFALPVWAVGLAGMAVVAATGQAVGPVLAGNVTGTANVTAQQSVVISSPNSDNQITGDGNGVVVVNDNGTSFTAAMEQHVGDTQVLHLRIANNSNASANAVLQLNVPAALDVSVGTSNPGSDELTEAMLSTSHDKTQQSFLLKVSSGNTETLDVTVSSKDDAAPGTYTISGGLVQIAG